MTDSPVPAAFIPLTDLELAQITADLAPMGFRHTQLFGLNIWMCGKRVIQAWEGQQFLMENRTKRFSVADALRNELDDPRTEFDSHISAATWLLLQDTQQVCPRCNDSGHEARVISISAIVHVPCAACIGEYVKV